MEERIAQLRKLALSFVESELPKTGESLGSVITVLERATSPKELLDSFRNFLLTFEREWCQDNYQARVHKALLLILTFFMKTKGSTPQQRQSIANLLPILQARRRAEQTLGGLAKLITPPLSAEIRLLLVSFLYLIAAEGVFDQTLRILRVLAALKSGKAIVYPTPDQVGLQTIRGQLKRVLGKRSSDILFEGYLSHLRNAIAHAHFTFDKQTNEMVFEDFDPSTGKRTWSPKRFDFKTVLDTYSKLEAVNAYLSFMFAIISVRDLLFAPSEPIGE